MPPNEARLFYSYSFDTGTLAAGGTATDSVSIEADSDFVLTKMSYLATNDAGAAQTESSRVIPLVTLQIIDTGSGRQWFDNEQPVYNLFGSGQIPFILPTPVKVRANSVLRANFTSLEAVDARRLFLSLVGFKLYRY